MGGVGEIPTHCFYGKGMVLSLNSNVCGISVSAAGGVATLERIQMLTV
jgi:hypothetical protein